MILLHYIFITKYTRCSVLPIQINASPNGCLFAMANFFVLGTGSSRAGAGACSFEQASGSSLIYFNYVLYSNISYRSPPS